MKTEFTRYTVLFSNETFDIPPSEALTKEDQEKLDSIVEIDLVVYSPSVPRANRLKLHTLHIPKDIAIKAGIWKEDKDVPKYPPRESTEDLLISLLQELGVKFEE